jgi:hypothetical protein
MTIAFVFWLLMLIWFLFGGYRNWSTFPAWFQDNLLLFLLIFLLGWKVFGWPIHG